MNILIILTSTIQVHENIVQLDRVNLQDRINDYTETLNYLIKKKITYDILLVDNSGYDIAVLNDKYSAINNINIVNVAKSQFDPKKGKGAGEALTLINLSESTNLKKYSHFLKITGRYQLKNIDSHIKEMEITKADIYADIKFSLTWMDTRVFGGSIEFLENYINKQYSYINDSESKYIEHASCRAALLAVLDGKIIFQMKDPILLSGIYGTLNMPYKSNFIVNCLKTVKMRIKNYIFK